VSEYNYNWGDWPQHGRLLNGVVVPCEMWQWARDFDDLNKRRIDSDYIEGAHVSTIFLGINHGFGLRPLWFETMVFDLVMFNDKNSPELQWRYETLAEAKAGHERACQWVREHIEVIRTERRETLKSELPDEHSQI